MGMQGKIEALNVELGWAYVDEQAEVSRLPHFGVR